MYAQFTSGRWSVGISRRDDIAYGIFDTLFALGFVDIDSAEQAAVNFTVQRQIINPSHKQSQYGTDVHIPLLKVKFNKFKKFLSDFFPLIGEISQKLFIFYLYDQNIFSTVGLPLNTT